MIDSDSQVQRGFFQHRRARINGVNGEGQPLPSQVLEGEIAMNLITRKLYTKRQRFFVTEYNNIVNDYNDSAGFIVSFADFDYDSDNINITYTINGNSKTLILDSEAGVAEVVSQFKNAAIAEVGSANVTSDTTSVTFYRNTGTASLSFSTNFIKYIDFYYQPVLRVGLNSSISLNSSNASTVIDFDLPSSGFRRTQGNGRLIAHVGSTLYLKDFTGIIAVGYKISQREPRQEYEIIELNNIPTVKPTAPEKALAAGNFWIRNRDSESGKLYWLDTSIMDDSDFQSSIRQMDSDERVQKNAVIVDSDGNGNNLFGEWRAIVSTSLLGTAGGNQFEGDVTFNNNVTIDSDLLVNGNVYIKGTLTVDSEVEFNDTVHIDSDLFVDGHVTTKDLDIKTVGANEVLYKNSSNTKIDGEPAFNYNATTNTLNFDNGLIDNNLTVSNSATISNDLTVGDNASITDDLTVGNNATISNNLTVGNNATISNDLTVSNSATISNDLTVGDNATITDDLTVGNNATVSNNLTVNGNFIFDSRTFDDTNRFTVKNVSGTVVISGYLLHTSSDVPNPGNN